MYMCLPKGKDNYNTYYKQFLFAYVTLCEEFSIRIQFKTPEDFI